MKKVVGILLICLFAIVFLTAFSACLGKTNTQGNEETEQKAVLTAISVDPASVPANVYAGSLVLSKIKLILQYDNGETETVDMKEEFLNVSGLNKLSEPGVQIVEVVYGTCRSSFTVVLLDPGKTKYRLTVQGGKPVSVNGVAVNYYLTEDAFKGDFDAGSIVEIEWTREDGLDFDSWTVGRTKVDTQPKTKVTMNRDYEYVAHSSEHLYTVTFVTFNQAVPVAPIKAKSIESETDIARQMTMENYDFVGWTDVPISQTEALSGVYSGSFVSFPYAISQSATFYAVWTPIGFSYTTYSTMYAGRTVEGKQIVSYSGTLSDLTIPAKSDGQNVIAISKDAFEGDNAKNLKSIFIPSTIVSIEEGAFRNCSALETFEVDKSSASSPFFADGGILYENDKTVLFAYPAGRVSESVVVEPGVMQICEYAFYNALVGVVGMPQGITRIGSHAFDSAHIDHLDFSQLRCSKIENNVGENLFNGLLHVIAVDGEQSEMNAYRTLFPEVADKVVENTSSVIHSVYEYEMLDGTKILFRLITGVYFDINNARTAEILGVTRSIKRLLIPDILDGRGSDYTVTSIAEYACSDCILLERVELPSTLERVSDHAFDGTPWSEELENESIIANDTLYKYLGNESEYVLAENIRRIAEGAFRNNRLIRNVDITMNTVLTRVDAFAFAGCISLRGFAAGTSETVFLVKPSLVKIAPYAFMETALVGIETQATAQGAGGALTQIGECAFADNYYLLNVELTVDALSTIDGQAFLRCYAIQNVNVSDNNATYASYDGIVYQRVGTGQYVLFYYPSGKMKAVFNPNKPTGEVNLCVTGISEYALQYANIGALVIDESVEEISTAAINIPSLKYIQFLSENTLYNRSYLGFVSVENAEHDQIGLTFVFSNNLPSSVVAGFFGNDVIEQTYGTTVVPCELFVVDSVMYAVTNDELEVVSVDRSISSIAIPKNVTLGGIGYSSKKIGKYSLIGYYATEIEIDGINEIEDYAFVDAFSLRIVMISETIVTDIPLIHEYSLGNKFNHGLLVSVACDPAEAEGYFMKWAGLIDVFEYADTEGTVCKVSPYLIYGEPMIVLTYRDKDNESHTSSIEYGTVSEAQIRAVDGKKAGYSAGNWFDVNDEESAYVIMTDGYAIPYNMVLECEWVADVYEITFRLPAGVSPSFTATYLGLNDGVAEYVVTLEFGAKYEFFVTDTEAYSYEFKGWTLEGKTLSASSTWTEVLPEKSCVLTPLREKRKYTIKYDATDEGVYLSDSEATVYYNEQYKLIIPSKNGYCFLGWQVKNGNDFVKLTSDNGASLSEWRITSSEAVTVYPIWKEIDVMISLKLDSIDDYDSAVIPYMSNTYSLPLDINNISASIIGKYRDKLSFFAGWQDADGKIYTSADGEALRAWDKYESTVLYAVWPEFIEDEATLIATLQADNKASIVLMSDITLTEQLAEEYNGVFNGNGRTITLNISDLNAGAIGLFKLNNGTVKNVKIEATIIVSDIAPIASETYMGIVCGKNSELGILENITVNVRRFTLSFTDVGSGKILKLGCICGVNDGSVKRICAYVDEFSIAIGEANGVAYIGTACGVNSGDVHFSMLDIRNFAIRYSGKEFGGELMTVGSIFGMLDGTVSGNARYALRVPENEYVYYQEVAQEAKKYGNEYVIVEKEYLVKIENSQGIALLENYDRYYVSSNNGMVPADQVYDDTATYYTWSWREHYSSYYYYDEYVIKQADQSYSDTKVYYKVNTSSSDYFGDKEKAFGIDIEGDSKELLFSTHGE